MSLEPRTAGASPRAGDDEDLVARARRGDRSAYTEIYQRHAATVWRRLSSLLGPDPEREDLMQQIFMDLFQALERFRGEASLRTYLKGIVVHTAYDHLRRRGRRPQLFPCEAFENLEAPGRSPEERAETQRRRVLIWSLLDRIKPKKRMAFVLRVVEGLSLAEIGEIVNANQHTVAQRIRCAHQELEVMLMKREGRS